MFTESVLSALSNNFWVTVALLAALPVSENRGAIIYALAHGGNTLLAYSLATAINIACVITAYYLIERSFVGRIAHALFHRHIEKKLAGNREKLEKYEEVALLLFVAVPMAGTGGYTGLLIASFLGMNFRKSSIIISLGIMMAGMITLLTGYGVAELLKNVAL